jgi:hypothetical protein
VVGVGFSEEVARTEGGDEGSMWVFGENSWTEPGADGSSL